MANKPYRDRHRKIGLCIDCLRPARPGGTRCPKHRLLNVMSTRKRRLRRLSEGRCTSCGVKLNSEADLGGQDCMNCEEKKAIRRRG